MPVSRKPDLCCLQTVLQALDKCINQWNHGLMSGQPGIEITVTLDTEKPVLQTMSGIWSVSADICEVSSRAVTV